MGTVGRLNRLHKAVPIIAFVVVVVAGILLPAPWGGIVMLLAVAVLGWLLFLIWPHTSMPERMFRLAVIVLTTAVATTRLFG